MDEQNENIDKEMDSIRMNQTEIPVLKKTVSKLENSIDGFNIRLGQEEGSANLKTSYFKLLSQKSKNKKE